MSSRPISLALTPGLLQWLQQDPLWQQQPLVWRIAQKWRALWSGINLTLSESNAAATSLDLQDPVLILGPWRSGTTALHELLSAATGLATPLTWHCMNAPAFRLLRSAPADAPLARPMDGLAISASSPQEDEFALLAMGQESSYRAFLMPHRLDELGHTLDPGFWLSNDEWLQPWESFLRGVLLAPGISARQPLILKSPNHSFRLPAIQRRFPGTRIVWMLREPRAVLDSNRKMWRSMFATHGISAEVPGSLDRFLALALQSSAALLRWCMSSLQETQWTVCQQEGLREHAGEEVARICRQLGLQADTDSAAFAASLASTAAGRIDRYAKAELPEALERAVAALGAAQTEALQRVAGRG